jgi:hypothetical protein
LGVSLEFLVEGGELLGSIGNNDGVLGVTLVILVVGRLGAVVALVGVVPRGSSIIALTSTIIGVRLRALIGVAPVFVVPMSFLGILHIGVLVDDHHHLGYCLQVAFKHLTLELDVVQALVEVVDDIPFIVLHNRVRVSEVLLVVVEGLIGLLGDTAKIPSSLGVRTGCLEVVGKGGAEILPAVDGAGRSPSSQFNA